MRVGFIYLSDVIRSIGFWVEGNLGGMERRQAPCDLIRSRIHNEYDFLVYLKDIIKIVVYLDFIQSLNIHQN
jgi:hypothetical protein